jgi:hypothetical protein
MLGSNEGKPQLGLIDYGQVKKLTKKERLHLCKIIIALANDDKKSIVRLLTEAGFKSKTMNEDVIYKYAKVSYDEDNDSLTEGKLTLFQIVIYIIPLYSHASYFLKANTFKCLWKTCRPVIPSVKCQVATLWLGGHQSCSADSHMHCGSLAALRKLGRQLLRGFFKQRRNQIRW